MHFPRPFRHIIRACRTPRDQPLPARVIPHPNAQSPLPKEILIVQLQLLQAGPRHIRQFQLRLLRRTRCLTALRDILHPRTRRLHHLIMRAAALIHVSVTKPHRDVIDQLRNPKGFQPPVTAVPGNQRFSVHFIPRPFRPLRPPRPPRPPQYLPSLSRATHPPRQRESIRARQPIPHAHFRPCGASANLEPLYGLVYIPTYWYTFIAGVFTVWGEHPSVNSRLSAIAFDQNGPR